MNRATRFRSFSPLSWPTHRSSKTVAAASRCKARGTYFDGTPETVSPYEESAYETDLEICLSTVTFRFLPVA
jgi:hypothetical protein